MTQVTIERELLERAAEHVPCADALWHELRAALQAAPAQPVNQVLVEAIFERCNVTLWLKSGEYPLEHNPHAKKDSKAAILAALAQAQAQPAPNPWKDAVLDRLASHAMDAPVDMPPADILKRVIDMAVTMATDPAIATQPAQGLTDGELEKYRLLIPGIDRIEPTDEFLSEDTSHWAIDPNAFFAGLLYGGNVLRPARRAAIQKGQQS